MNTNLDIYDTAVAQALLESGLDALTVASHLNLPVEEVMLVMHQLDPDDVQGTMRRIWTDEEEAFVRQNINHISIEKMAQHLKRTPSAVKVWSKRKGIYLSTDNRHLSTTDVQHLMGVSDVRTVHRWIERGLLTGRMLPDSGQYDFTMREVSRFAVNPENWYAIDIDKITDPRLHKMCQIRRERWHDEWLTTGQVQEMLGLLGTNSISRRIREGSLPAKRWDNHYIKRSDAEAMVVYPLSKSRTNQSYPRSLEAIVLLMNAIGLPTRMIAPLTNASNRDLNSILSGLKYKYIDFAVDKLLNEEGLAVSFRQNGSVRHFHVDFRPYLGRFHKLRQHVAQWRDDYTLSKDPHLISGLIKSWVCFHRPDSKLSRFLLSCSGHNRSAKKVKKIEQTAVQMGMTPIGEGWS